MEKVAAMVRLLNKIRGKRVAYIEGVHFSISISHTATFAEWSDLASLEYFVLSTPTFF